MPRRATLKVVSRPGTQTLYIRGTVKGLGRSVFESTGVVELALAEQILTKRSLELHREAIYGPAPEAVKKREHTFAEGIVSYLEVAKRSKNTKAYLKRLLTTAGDIPLREMNQAALDQTYKDMFKGEVTESTKLRQALTPWRAVLEHSVTRGLLSRADLPELQAPIAEERPKVAFTPDEVIRLIRAAAPGLRPLLAFAVATGARPAEYLDLNWLDVDLEAGRVRFVLKGSRNRQRIRHHDMCSLSSDSRVGQRMGHAFAVESGGAMPEFG